MTTGGGSRSSGSIKSSTEWSPELEMKFYASLCTHRPSGVSKHFMMALVLNDLKGNLDGETLWKKLEDLYDLRALEKVAVKDEDPFFFMRMEKHQNSPYPKETLAVGLFYLCHFYYYFGLAFDGSLVIDGKQRGGSTSSTKEKKDVFQYPKEFNK
ncbi:MRGBP [Lepeophtheirus salmonis]|uniref:MRGBP n=1 Tax=Lepeophtheirus salmonis TaxID=72036 RepID=A0A7R8CRR2_LEPSM|nr:MRGBP [Lepeophtheirus salmonis]CAF2908127.1 MRGBP [Lepeophtheirus salmonis]